MIVVLSYFCFVASSVHRVGQSVFLCSVSCLELELPINSLFLQMNGANCGPHIIFILGDCWSRLAFNKGASWKIIQAVVSLAVDNPSPFIWNSSLDKANAIPVYGHLCLRMHDVRGRLLALSCVPGSMESICCVEQISGLLVLLSI